MFKEISLSRGRQLVCAYSKGSEKLWIVYIPESGSPFLNGSRNELKKLINSPVSNEVNFLSLNKPGMTKKGKHPKKFESSFRHELRVKDYKKAIKTIIPKDHPIILIGYSEGAYLAPTLARSLTNVIGISMIGGGTRGWIKEELNNAKKEGRTQDLQKIKNILASPTSKKTWNGFSYSTWYSYRKDSTFRDLKTLRVPILAIVGARDNVIDLETTVEDFKTLKDIVPLKYKMLPRCGHDFGKHWGSVSNLLTGFVLDLIDHRANTRPAKFSRQNSVY